MQTKVCTGCDVPKSLDAFAKHPNARHGRTNRCRPCKSEYDSERYQRNQDAIKARVRQHREDNLERVLAAQTRYREQNREMLAEKQSVYQARRYQEDPAFRDQMYLNTEVRRARLAEVLTIPFTQEQLEARLSMWGFRCRMCGGPYEALDHVKPISIGGAHILANIRPACTPCNSSKGATWPLN